VAATVTPPSEPRTAGACDDCLARTWLLGLLGGRLEPVRSRIEPLLELDDDELIAAVAGRDAAALTREHSRRAVERAGESRERARSAGLELICRCDPAYPASLAALAAPPAVLHVAGGARRLLELGGADPVAIVGTRAASQYGLDVAAALGRGLGAAGLTVVSGLALGIDAAAHTGTLAAHGGTVAVLPGSADRVYPASKRRLHQGILATGVAVSEVGPGSRVWRWSFQARNRLIAGLSAMTVVVEAGARSGALMTARIAAELGRPVGAVPGPVTSLRATGTNALLAAGATVVRGAQDVLDALFGAGTRVATPDVRSPPTPAQARLLREIGGGRDTIARLARKARDDQWPGEGARPEDVLVDLAALETAGWIRRGAGGRYTVVP